MSKLLKPRTNHDAAEWWAAHILLREQADLSRYVNSIEITRDAIYSFGHHYPMGRIVRDAEGNVRRVVVTSASYPSRGFANTPGDQWAVIAAARDALTKLNRERPESKRVELEFLPLSSHGLPHDGRIQVLPRPEDPEVPEVYISVIPTFHASDPGPEPIWTDEGCIAGRREEYSFECDDYMTSNLHLQADDQAYTVDGYSTPKPGDFLYRQSHGSIYALRARNGVIVWGRDRWGSSSERTSYKQCPHCESFDAVHDRWRVQARGQWGMGRFKGYEVYSEMIEAYGSVQGWAEARRANISWVRKQRKLRSEWIERNFIPLHAVSYDADGLPKLVDGRYAMRKDEEAYLKAQRERERRDRRAARQMAEREQMRQRIQKLMDRRARRKAETFFGRADRVANELAALRRELATTNELES